MSHCLVNIRFRLGWIHQGNNLSDLPFKAEIFPYTSICAFLMGCLIVAGEGYVAATTRPFAWANIVAAYIGIAVFFILCGIWKVLKKISTPGDEEIAALNELERMGVKTWKELKARGRAPKVGRAVHWVVS
ncbi:hypothetical protein BPOR_0236g00070 [Botrytis porri]|uniref:Amino acid permease/ SLC12A domain-containing protein n=1 Tax=Botrytis porri TaxID=87229 RepID=A0A4Z1KRT5_9HELO|nr:hypothetical protein BPOR_0236g00070 [Botrytis porri]